MVSVTPTTGDAGLAGQGLDVLGDRAHHLNVVQQHPYLAR
jgi:hypothetical protein